MSPTTLRHPNNGGPMRGLTPPGPVGVAPRRPQEVSRHDPNHLWMQKSDFAKKQFSKSRSIEGSNQFIFRDDRECVDRIHRKYQVAMTLPEIDPRLPRPRGTYFGGRGPWGALFARSGNNNKMTQGTHKGLTRRWAHGPANS